MVSETEKILIVDDDARVLRTFSRNLSLEGYTVLTADSGQSALDLYALEHPEIVLVDVRMPYMDGFEVLAAIRERDPESEVILVTGHGDVDMTIAALRAGASDFIPKPVEKATLQAALRRSRERLRLQRELRAATEALKQERALLAQRVAERTAELSAANAELARAARLKDEFLANMSHELRTPLNAILGMSEVLRRELYGPLNEKQAKYMQTIEESGHHLLNLINDILDLSKIEAGKFDLQFAQVPVAALCKESLWLVQQQAREKQLELVVSVDEMIKNVWADRRRLKQVLVNLLSNAVKFTPEGGQVGLEVTGDVEQQVVRFTVWDTGVGIASEDIERLFRPFVQLDSSLSRQHEGTGLGLALVYRLTDMQGGSVAVESEHGQGSRFIISLPWKRKSLEEPGDDTAPDALNQACAFPIFDEARPLTVLLAEDNQASIDTISSYLLAGNFCVSVARNGAEAIERAREDHPDVILMDIQMPGMDGLDATRRIRADASLEAMPIIALTALTMPGDRERCLDAGMDVYISKPISMAHLFAVIHGLLQRKEDKHG